MPPLNEAVKTSFPHKREESGKNSWDERYLFGIGFSSKKSKNNGG
jgi:hypothetical protein